MRAILPKVDHSRGPIAAPKPSLSDLEICLSTDTERCTDGRPIRSPITGAHLVPPTLHDQRAFVPSGNLTGRETSLSLLRPAHRSRTLRCASTHAHRLAAAPPPRHEDQPRADWMPPSARRWIAVREHLAQASEVSIQRFASVLGKWQRAHCRSEKPVDCSPDHLLFSRAVA